MIQRFKIQKLLPSIFFILFISCGQPENKSSSLVDSASKDNVRVVDSIIPVVDTNAIHTTVNSKQANQDDTTGKIITGYAYYNLPYCGGMMPSKERLDELAKWKNLYYATLILKNKSIEKEILIEYNGSFATDIPPGTYDVYLKKINKEIWDISENGCKDCLTKPITTVKLVYGKMNEIRFTFRCPPGLRE